MKKVILGILMPLLIVSCQMKKNVDLIIYNTLIYTVDSSFSKQNALAVKDGIIVAVGTDEDILSSYKSANMVDLKDGVVYPGFNDTHCHLVSMGEGLMKVDLRGARSFEEVVQRLSDRHDESPSQFLLGDGWDQNLWPGKNFPENTRLNELFPDIPVILKRIDYHAVIVNDAAIKLMGLIPNDPSIAEGEAIVKNGKFTGLFLENTADRFKDLVPDPNNNELRKTILAAEKECFKYGLTSVTMAGSSLQYLEVLDSMQNENNLKIRIDLMISPSEEMFDAVGKPYTKGRLRVATIKMFADGALGSRGALMIKPYTDNPLTSGIQATPTSVLEANAAWASEHGFQVSTHCIGDLANRLMLNIYSKYLTQNNDLRWRIEHSQIIDPSDMHLFGKYKIVPSIQPTHATSDMLWATERVGDRIKGAYAYRELLQQMGWLPSGTDFPIEEVNPIYTFFAAVHRVNLDFIPNEGFQMENALTPEQALKSMTIWAAKSSFEEDIKGSIEVGKYADFTVLNADMIEAKREDVPGIKVLRTFVAGEVVYMAQ